MAETVLITGSNRGLGLELARQYADEGWNVLATCRDPEAAEDLRALASSHGDRMHLLRLDVAQESSLMELVGEIEGTAIDLLVNNAGTMGERGFIDEVGPDEIARVFDVNVVGPYRVTRTLLPYVQKGAGRTIAFVTSKVGSIGDGPSGGMYPYRISKTALNMLGANLAVDLRDREITTVLLHPGWVRTRMGGPSAPTSVEESVSGMRRVLAGLSLEDSGKFFHAEGHEIPW